MPDSLGGAFVNRRLALAGLGVSLSACSVGRFNYVDKDAPQVQIDIQPMRPVPKLALVLGSGGPRGFAHIGVLKVFEEAGIKPDLIVGSSVGALVGSLWASGLSAEDMRTKALAGGPLSVFDFSVFADRGWIHGQRLQDLVNDYVGGRLLEELAIPMIVVATQRDEKKPAFFLKGNTGVAVRASSAVPTIISPVGIQGREYEDADTSLPVAVSAAKRTGAQFVIAVDVAAHAGSAPPNTSVEWLEKDQRRRVMIDEQTREANFVIHPDLGYIASPRQEYALMCMRVGEETARKQLPALKKALPKS